MFNVGKFTALLESRRFMVAVGGVILAASSELFNVDLNPDMVTNVLLMLSAWVIGQSLKPTLPLNQQEVK